MKNFGLEKIQRFYPALVFILLGYLIADLGILSIRDIMLPDQAPPTKPKRMRSDSYQPKSTYASLINRNIFNSDGLIPDPVVPAGQEGKSQNQDAAPVLSSLPLNLAGTIVHSNPEKSIANIELKGKNTVLAFHPKQDIDKIANLISIERNKVIFRNLNNQRLEYIEIKNASTVNFQGAKPAGNSEVQVVGDNHLQIKRDTIKKYTDNMAQVLQQAAMAPKRGANGEIECFKFLSIQPNSIYTQLSFQQGDCIKSVNGMPIDSPAKAMEMYNQLKNSNSINMKVERDGRDQDIDFSVTE